MSTKFFNNRLGNTLFDKLKGIASEMATFDRFLAVVGFFRSSGYFRLRKELGRISSAVLVRSSSEEQLSKISFLFSVLIIKASLNPVLIP